MESCPDLLELSALLQCLGFSVKAVETNMSSSIAGRESATRNVTISCQCSGISVVLEGEGSGCSCPAADLHNSGIWQVTGITAGKHIKQEYGSTILSEMPKSERDSIISHLRAIMQIINECKEIQGQKFCESETNVSLGSCKTTTLDIGSQVQLKIDTPTRYRSLDALSSVKVSADQTFSSPVNIQKDIQLTSANVKMKLCRRESTYSVESSQSNIAEAPETRGNKTSSPNQENQIKATLENLRIAKEATEHLCMKLNDLKLAQNAAEKLRSKLQDIIRNYPESNHDASICSIASDISRISLLKPLDSSKVQYASSPNIYYSNPNESSKAMDNSSVSIGRQTSIRDRGSCSKLPILNKSNSKMSKIGNIFKTKPVNSTKKYTIQPKTNFSPNLSASRNKYSHIKSTIPKPAPKK